ncbi:hypothetical protein BJ170DRAFT_589978 [Xylariales sp. AK1849]|nr:hypothetical protein BJ170DRAFT_589978 [Xylariales sp. AK1849]
MGRWSHYDTDEERLPEGMTRIGYDADDQTYTYRDTDGSTWESAPGSQYGRLTRVSGPPQPRDTDGSTRESAPGRQYGRLAGVSGPPQPRDSFEDDDREGPSPPYTIVEPEVSWRHEMRPLFNFFLIIGLFLIGVFFYLRTFAGRRDEVPTVQCRQGSTSYGIKAGDTCWAIAEIWGSSVEALVKENKGLDCDNLIIGRILCVPTD